MSALIPQSNQVPSSHVEGSPAMAPAAQMPRISFREIFNAIVRWSWIPVACLLIGAIGTCLYVSGKPDYYTATGNLEVKAKAPEIFENSPLADDDSKSLEQMKTVEQGLVSSTVLLEIVERYNLAADPHIRKMVHNPISDPATEKQAILQILYDNITVELQKGTRLINIQVEDTSPDRAAQIVESIVEEYEIWKERENRELVTLASAGLSSEEQRLEKKLDAADYQLEEFRAEHLVLGLDGTQQRLQSGKLEALTQELSSAENERLNLEARFGALKAAGGDENAAMLAARGEKGQLALSLEGEINQKEAEFAQLKERYKFKHPSYIEAEGALKLLKKRLETIIGQAESSLENDLKIAKMREGELRQLVEGAKISALNDEAIREQFAKLTRAAESARQLHSQVSTRLEQTEIGATLNTTSFLTWNERPLVPRFASGPQKKGYVIVGAFLGGLLGLFLAMVLSLGDPRVRESSAVERKLRLPILAHLPVFSRDVVREMGVEGDALATLNRPAHMAPYAPASSEDSDPMQALLFVSPFDGDGKTLCVMKCARTMVRQGYRTLVVDADFSQAGLSRDYGRQYNYRHGLAAYLTGEAEPAEVLFETGLPGLWFLPTGNIEKDSGQLLSGPSLRQLLQAIGPMFDRVIFDIASISNNDDVQAVARFINSTYLVARKGRGKYRDLKETCETIQSAGGNVSGVIWNDGGVRRGPGLPIVIEPVTYPSEVREVSPRGQNEPMPAPPEMRAL